MADIVCRGSGARRAAGPSCACGALKRRQDPGITVAGQAAAQVPKPNVFDGGNRWLITAFDDSSAVHQQWATQGICFLPYAVNGTHIRGVWTWAAGSGRSGGSSGLTAPSSSSVTRA